MNKIILTQGIQGSGKTTWAKAWVAEDPTYRIRINNDDITSMWGQPFGTPNLYNRLAQFRQLMIKSFMEEGLDIVVDNMNLSDNSIKEIEKLVEEYNSSVNFLPKYEIEYKDFTKIPLEICIERDSKREHPVGERVIRYTYNKYLNTNK